MHRIVLLALLGSAALQAQKFSLGLLGGAPFTDVVDSVNNSGIQFLPRSQNFVVGPAMRIGLPAHFRFEVDALYRPYEFAVVPTGSTTGTTVSASQWRFPFLLQYSVNTPVLKPFFEGGLSFDHLSNISAAARNITSGPGTLVDRSHASVVLGAGLDLKLGFIRLSGELRWSHAGSADFQAITKANQAEALLGIHF